MIRLAKCDECGEECDRIEEKKDPDFHYCCCKCSLPHIDSLCDKCETRNIGD